MSDLNKNISAQWRELIHHFFVLSRKIRRAALADVKPCLSTEQERVLRILTWNGELTMTNLADRIGIRTPSLTVLTGHLLESKLLERTHSLQDRRVVTVKLTQKGRDFLKRNEKKIEKYISGMIQNLPPPKRKRLCEIAPEMLALSRDFLHGFPSKK